jgi:HEPN domain-containing protein
MKTWPSILSDIKNCLQPIIIYKLASLEKRGITTHIFSESNHTTIGDYHHHFLIVAEDLNHKNSESLQEAIEAKCAPHTSLTCWVIRYTDFLNGLLQGNYFYHSIVSKTAALWRQETVPELPAIFPASIPKPDPSAFINRARQFLATADLLLLRNQPALAAFQLHQAAEQSLTALVFGKTGYRPPTHNLVRLHGYAQLFQPELSEHLPLHPARDPLLQQLQKAYIGSRYSNDFTIKKTTIEILYQAFEQLIRKLSLPESVNSLLPV